MTRVQWGRVFFAAAMILGVWGCSDEKQTSSSSGSTDDDTTVDGDTSNDSSSEDGGADSDSNNSDDTEENPCLGENPPESCHLEPSAPACGDGKFNQDWEVCDDGNTLPGDGCNGACKVEPNFECREFGEPCVLLIICGNSKVEAGEVCDDGNTNPDDGCDDKCQQDASYICVTPGDLCEKVAFCGNGRVEGSEDCDEGSNTTDGCVDCEIQDGWVCKYPGQECLPAPRCGDGILQVTRKEACDDGNDVDGDGCSASCLIESGYECPDGPGNLCVTIEAICGDGALEGDEACDDDNETAGDGCTADCEIEEGYECPYPGAPCVTQCGDGIKADNEECDDGNKVSNDGCSYPACEWEEGWACLIKVSGDYNCVVNPCGDGLPTNDAYHTAEACDDGNDIIGDGCSPNCKVEPLCAAVDEACTTECGDGLILGDERCDDGNRADGDGCSSNCLVEAGFTCKQPPLEGTMEVPATYRDFRRADTHFEESDQAECGTAINAGMVEVALDANGKPVSSSVGGSGSGCPEIPSQDDMRAWFDDDINDADIISGTLTLWDNGKGGYVNRWGDDGEKWDGLYDGNPVFFPMDGYGSTPSSEYATAGIPTEVYDGGWNTESPAVKHNFHFTSEVRYWFVFHHNELVVSDTCDTGGVRNPATGGPCWYKGAAGESCASVCAYRGGYNTATNNVAGYGGTDEKCEELANQLGIELANGQSVAHETWNVGCGCYGDDSTNAWWLIRESSEATTAECAPGGRSRICACGDGDGGVVNGPKYVDGDMVLNFTGDDDVWVFVNGELVVDLGGVHAPVEGAVNINHEVREGNLDLADGEIYEIVVFQVERHTDGSSYRLTLSGFNASPSECGPICGNGVVTPGEQCDDGTNNNDTAYGGCTTDCVLGPRCGDGTRNGDEDCDNGVNSDAYGASGGGACAKNCEDPASCGDGIVQPEYGETCDDGVNDGRYGGCSSDCQLGPFCGDGDVDAAAGEECDDGANDGTYNTCDVGCVFGPRCGDGTIQDSWGEECDGDVLPDDAPTDAVCADTCKFAGQCGDGVVGIDEECDDGVNDGGYGECAPGCVLGPYCGDGVVQVEEACDAGEYNTGGYGECAPGCVLGPHCGDGVRQDGYELCDDGDDDDSDGCTNACVTNVIIG